MTVWLAAAEAASKDHFVLSALSILKMHHDAIGV